MTQSSRATERSKFSLHRAALMFSHHLDTHARATSGWMSTIHEGSELLASAAEQRRLHIRESLIGLAEKREHAI
jgi:hypothetical protein